MLSFITRRVSQYVFVVLISMILTACQQPATYAPVKTVNQAVLTDDEAELRKEREHRKQVRNKTKSITKKPMVTPSERVDSGNHQQNTDNLSAIQSIPSEPISPNLTKQQSNKPNKAFHVNPQPKPTEFNSLRKSGKQTHQETKFNTDPVLSKLTKQLPRSTRDDTSDILKAENNKKSQKNQLNIDSAQPKNEKNTKNSQEKTLSISNNNKKVLKLNFEWPFRGKVIKNFTESDNKGIDIAGKIGQNVHATESGKTVYCGHGLLGYGNLIIVKHDQTYLSAYAHNSKLHVKEGQMVEKGQTIAEIGTGNSHKPVILHFQIRKNGKSINPLALLPK